MTRNIHPPGHTRLPRYARGKRGVIHRPRTADLSRHQRRRTGRTPSAVYNVRFEAQELWGDSAEPGTTVSLDLWESYLEPAPLRLAGG